MILMRKNRGGVSSLELAENPMAQEGLSQELPPHMAAPICFICGLAPAKKTPPEDAVMIESVSGTEDMEKFYREAPLGSEVTVETKWKCKTCNLPAPEPAQTQESK